MGFQVKSDQKGKISTRGAWSIDWQLPSWAVTEGEAGTSDLLKMAWRSNDDREALTLVWVSK